MARGTISSFIDGLQGLLPEVLSLGAAPDADLDFVMELRQMILDKLMGAAQDQAAQVAGVEPSSQGPPMMPGGGEGELSRGPMPGPPQPSANDLQRILSG